jgi:Skp family chaperone for outer membrane proteins
MRYFVYAIFMCLVIMPVTVMATDVERMSIAVVDVNQLMNASVAAKSIQSQAKTTRSTYQKKIKKIESDLKKLEQKVIDAGKAEDKKAFIKNRDTFQKEMANSQKRLIELNQKMDKSVGDALNKLRDEIVEIVAYIASDRDYDLVISRADVVVVAKSMDITSDVMDALNSKITTIRVRN